jgi:transcriptional regulator with GAF, ATPase, and Fis domain
MSQQESKSTQLITDELVSIKRDLDRLRLVVIEGADSGRSCEVTNDTISIGTDAACDLVLADNTVSRKHLLARKDNNGIWLQDQQSSNGTFYQGSQVKEIVVGLGATIKLGKTELKVAPFEKRLNPKATKEESFYGVLATNKKMREIFASLKEVAETNLTVLFQGETGTGKEVMAEAVHQASSRKDRPFVVIDCTTIPNNLAESELFGHCKGAFTGAVADRIGCFEQANGGTIFIDEVGDLPKELQPKLLRVLERRQIKPVGSTISKEVDVRVIAATNKDLKTEVEENQFREDLYYRIAVVSITLPPLRERPEDLEILIKHFAKQASPHELEVELPKVALNNLAAYGWPGNIRELRNVVERAVAFQRSKEFDYDSFMKEAARSIGESSAKNIDSLPFKQAKSQVVDSFEKAYLSDLIKQHKGNVSKAAREAQLDRHHLKDLLKKHGIKAK